MTNLSTKYGIGGSGSSLETTLEKTANYTIVDGDTGRLILLTSATAADREFTLPALSTTNDKTIFYVGKDTAYKLTLKSTGNDRVGHSGDGYGVETLDGGSAVITVLADNTNKKWHVLDNSGRWAVEGAKIYAPLDLLYVYDAAHTTLSGAKELFFNQAIYTYGGIKTSAIVPSPFASIPGTSFQFDGVDAYLGFFRGENCDLFGSLTDDWTFSFLVRFDAAASSNEYFFAHYEDTSNRFFAYRATAGTMNLSMIAGGSTIVNFNSVSTIPGTTWTQIDFVKVGSNIAIYIDGDYENHASISTADAFNAILDIGQNGNDNAHLDGNMQDFFMVNQNLYGVDPTSVVSTVPVRTKPIDLIYN